MVSAYCLDYHNWVCIPRNVEDNFKEMLSDVYVYSDILATSYLETDGKIIDGICVYTTNGYDINVAFYGGYGSLRDEYWSYFEDIEMYLWFSSSIVLDDFCYDVPGGVYSVSFNLCYDNMDIPDDADGFFELEFDSRTVYFYWRISPINDYAEISAERLIVI